MFKITTFIKLIFQTSLQINVKRHYVVVGCLIYPNNWYFILIRNAELNLVNTTA